ncbi:MAG: hypothetical protein Q4P15_03165 [Propionibacteriaceae bacterium]|nr:hypothetical protein [Propionibacteriaceae bacterium]
MSTSPERPLFRHDGSQAAEDHLRSLGEGFEPGHVLAVFHAWPTPGFLAWFIVPGLVAAVFAIFAAPDPFIAIVPLGLFWGIAMVFVIGGWFDRHRVCEHALVLGAQGKLVIPFETIDPGRLYDIDKGAAFLGRHTDISTGAVHGSTGPLLLINGLQRAMWSPNHGGALPTPDSPFGFYTVGTRRQEEFLDILESAMVADGFTEARGLSRSTFALRQVRLAYSQAGPSYFNDRGANDPPLGVNAPAPRTDPGQSA